MTSACDFIHETRDIPNTNARSCSQELLSRYKESLEKLSIDRFVAQKDLPRSVYVREIRAPTASLGTQTDPWHSMDEKANAEFFCDKDEGERQGIEDDFYYSENEGSDDADGELPDSDLGAELSSPWRVAEEFATGRKY